MNSTQKNMMKKELEGQGFSVSEITSWPAKHTYYKPDGEALPNLPADPESMQRYIKRGFTLVKPKPQKAKKENV